MAKPVMMAAAVVMLAAWGGSAAARAQGATTNDGVYTAAQASAGEELYGQVCANCHQPAKFTGAEFTRAYVGRPLNGINEAMAEMPMDNPGSLTAEDTGALIAYFLSMNKYPTGQTALKGDAESLKAIMVSPRPQ